MTRSGIAPVAPGVDFCVTTSGGSRANWPRTSVRILMADGRFRGEADMSEVWLGRERSARQSRPLDRAFALLDPLLARPALVVESNDALGWAMILDHPAASLEIRRADRFLRLR